MEMAWRELKNGGKRSVGNTASPDSVHNMEVSKANFEEVLTRLEEIIKDVQFIAFDTEFTGLRVEGANNLNFYDTLDDLYIKYKEKAEKFMAIQYGLVLFFYDEESKEHTHEAYNFYIFPSVENPDVNFTCEIASVSFLVKNGMDFNKVFGQGIPFLREMDKDRLISDLAEKYERKIEQSPKSEVTIPDENKPLIDEIHKRIEQFLKPDNKDTSFNIDSHNSFIRRLIYNSTREKFGSKIYLQTNKDYTMTVTAGLSENDIKNIQDGKFQSEKQEILDNVGFTKLIKLIINSGKPLVGHNMLLDLLFTIRHFIQPLPDTYNEFKELVHFLFPKMLDTKFMAITTDIDYVKKRNLITLFEEFQNIKCIPDVKVSSEGRGYDLEQQHKPHEAAFDAYVTGLCFMGMLDLKAVKPSLDVFKNVSDSPILDSTWNKLHVPKLHDIPFMNIGGKDVEPSRPGVFHLTFPKNWKRDNIFNLFKDCGFLSISWINDTSAFVGVKDEFIKKVKKSLMKVNFEYEICTYEEFKRNRSNKRNGDNEDYVSRLRKKESVSSQLVTNIKSNSGENKRAQVEDIGEPVSPPTKKMCSFQTPAFE